MQQVFVAPGDTISDGDSVARVAGITRVAAATAMPFYRVLTPESQGDDVVMLAGFLRTNGIDAPETDLFDSEMLQAVRLFADRIGLQDSSEVFGFDPSWVLFLPEAGEVQEVALSIGAPAPSSGTSVLALAPTILDAVLLEEGTLIPEKAEGAVMSPSEIAAGQEYLSVGGIHLSIGDSRQQVSSEDLDQLATLVSAQASTVPAHLAQPAGAHMWHVPVPALVSDDTGSCLWVLRDESEVQISVRPVLTSLGTVTVEGHVEANDRVAIYPVKSELSCG